MVPAPPPSGPVDLSELLQEIRRLRLQLERSIQTNTALRQRLEEQLLRGPNRSDTININYLLSSPEEGGRSPGREAADFLLRHSEHTTVQHGRISTSRPEQTRSASSFSKASFFPNSPLCRREAAASLRRLPQQQQQLGRQRLGRPVPPGAGTPAVGRPRRPPRPGPDRGLQRPEEADL